MYRTCPNHMKKTTWHSLLRVLCSICCFCCGPTRNPAHTFVSVLDECQSNWGAAQGAALLWNMWLSSSCSSQPPGYAWTHRPSSLPPLFSNCALHSSYRTSNITICSLAQKKISLIVQASSLYPQYMTHSWYLMTRGSSATETSSIFRAADWIR